MTYALYADLEAIVLNRTMKWARGQPVDVPLQDGDPLSYTRAVSEPLQNI